MLKFDQFISKALNEELLIEKRDDRMIAPKFTKKEIDNNRRIFLAIGDVIRQTIRKELDLRWKIESLKFVPYRGIEGNRYYRTDVVASARGSVTHTNTGIEIVIDSRVPSIAIYNYPLVNSKPFWSKSDADQAVVLASKKVVDIINKAGKCEGKKVNRGYYIKISQLDYDKLPKSNIRLIRGDSNMFGRVKDGREDKMASRFDDIMSTSADNKQTIRQWIRSHKGRTNKFDTYKGWKIATAVAKQYDLEISGYEPGWGVRYNLDRGLVKSVDLVLSFAIEINGQTQYFGALNSYNTPRISVEFDQRKSIDSIEKMTIGELWPSLKIVPVKQDNEYSSDIKQAIKELIVELKNVKVSDFGPITNL